MNIFQIQLLYYVGVTLVIAALCAYNGLALARARGKRLKFVVTWLLPFFVGNLLSLPNVFIQDYHFLTGTRATAPSYLLMLALPLASGIVFIYGTTRLLKVIQDTPASDAQAPSGGASVSNNGDAWPPPPNSPAA